MHVIQVYVIIYFLIPRYLLATKYLNFILGIIILTLFVSAISPVIAHFIVVPLREKVGIDPPFNSIFYGLISGLRGSSTVAGFAAMIKLSKLWYIKNIYNQQLEKEKVKAELELLKSQLHPHFLFNTLNNLYGMILEKSDKSAEIVLKLSEMLRYVLYETKKEKVPLERELEFISNYISLEKMRYSDLEVSIDIKGDVKGVRVVPALFLPFVENAFKYGVSERLEQSWIKMQLKIEDDMLSFKLINSKVLKETGVTPHKGGIGLLNIRKRLQMQYPEMFELETKEYDQIFVVRLVLRIERHEATNERDAKIKVPVSR